MKPINFSDSNTTFAEHQEEYLQLPARVKDDEEGVILSCWNMGFFERVKVFFTGNIWVEQMTFHKPLQPQKISVHKP